MGQIFLGIKGHVLCLNKETGKELWRTKMRSTTITNVLHEGGYIYAYAGGQFYCLNAKDGNIVWENGLVGMGYGPCIIANENQGSAMVASQLANQQAALVQSASIGAGSGDGSDGGGE